VVDYENLEHSSEKFRGVDSAFCCLGTTRAKAGKEGFVKVDHDYVLSAAKLLQSSNCPDFHLLSSKGSSASSWILYTSTKGQVEEATKKLNFPRLCIYRPGVLMCDREEKRLGESCVRWVAGLVDKTSMGWSVTTKMVAAAMVATSLSAPGQGVEVWEVVIFSENSLFCCRL
jgi:oxidoreductase